MHRLNNQKAPPNPRVQPPRVTRSFNWLVLLAKVQVSDRAILDPRGRLTLAVRRSVQKRRSKPNRSVR